MRVRKGKGVLFRPETFGGVCYVPKRDDLFAVTHSVFGLFKHLADDWRTLGKNEVPSYRALARLGICETNPATPEIAYSGPSLLGKFEEFPSISEPLVVNCFSTSHCPLKCLYCHADDLMESAERRAEDAAGLVGLQNVINTASCFQNLVCVITGGDPLTRPERARFLIGALAGSQKGIVLDTSGVGDIRSLLPELRRYNVHVRVSLDAAGPIHDKLRPVNRKGYGIAGLSSDHAKQTIRLCLANDIPVTVQTVVTSRNDHEDELIQLREWLVQNGVRHWVLHIAVEAGKARLWERASRTKDGPRSLLSNEHRLAYTLRKMVNAERAIGGLDIRITDTNRRPNSVILIDSVGNLQTEGFAHVGKIQLFDAGARRPDLVKAKWSHIDSFGHAVRYLNWNRWMYPDTSIEELCYPVPVPPDTNRRAMVVETESKYKVRDVVALRLALEAEGWKAAETVLQRDEYYDTGSRYLTASDFVMRVRTEGQRKKFAFKGPRVFESDGSSRVEIELDVSEDDHTSAFRNRGLERTWILEKRRTTFKKPGSRLVVELDELPDIGWFVEFEGPVEEGRVLRLVLGDVVGAPERLHYADLVREFKSRGGPAATECEGAVFCAE